MKGSRTKPVVFNIPAANPKEDYAASMVNVLSHRAFRLLSAFLENQLVALKGSCGESPEEGARLAAYIKAAGLYLKQRKVSVFMCDTTNRHKDISSNALKQIEEARCQCFDELRDLFSFFMLDGINGSYEYVRKVRKLGGVEVYLAGELPNLDGMFAVSAPFAHHRCGVAGALYSLGAGLASKRGKIKQHTMDKPKVRVERCYACKRCLKECPVKAIWMDGHHVAIDDDRCVDCGRCVEIAKRCGISYAWNATTDHFRRKVIEHAAGAMEVLKGRIVLANVLFDGKGRLKRILISRDPVALDAATVEACRANGLFDPDALDELESQISAAETAGIGNAAFQGEEIAY